MSKRSYASVYYYCGKEFIFSFFVAFLFFFFIFFVNQLLLLAEDILSKHVPLKDVFLLILYSLPLILSLSFPFSSLVGALMAIGRLYSNNEILAFQVSGIPSLKIFLPFFFLGILFAFSSFIMNDYFLPAGTLNFGKLYRQLLYANPEMELEANSIKYYQDSVIVTGDIKGNKIYNIKIIDKTPENEKRIISAESGFLSEKYTQQGVVSLELETVFSQIIDPKKNRVYEYLRADAMTYNILIKDISFSIRNPGPAEMRSIDVWYSIQEKKNDLRDKEKLNKKNSQNEKYKLEMILKKTIDSGKPNQAALNAISQQLQRYRNFADRKISNRTLTIYQLEFNKKFAVPLACFLFIFLAVPAGMITGNRGRAVGFGVGLLFSLVYWTLLFAGQTLGVRMDVSPLLAMWSPNLFILFTAFALFLVRTSK